jgi:4-hydroxybutyryl-CoA dehydratase/vinylacetyl-CoA-Delta-isomerase
MLKTGNEYRESLKSLKLKVYMFGERIENPIDHPIIRPSVNAVAMTYALAHDPKYEDIATARSHLTGEKINRFTHIHQSIDDLVKKIKFLRILEAVQQLFNSRK